MNTYCWTHGTYTVKRFEHVTVFYVLSFSVYKSTTLYDETKLCLCEFSSFVILNHPISDEIRMMKLYFLFVEETTDPRRTGAFGFFLSQWRDSSRRSNFQQRCQSETILCLLSMGLLCHIHTGTISTRYTYIMQNDEIGFF